MSAPSIPHPRIVSGVHLLLPIRSHYFSIKFISPRKGNNTEPEVK
jgi:hypothetical protein